MRARHYPVKSIDIFGRDPATAGREFPHGAASDVSFGYALAAIDTNGGDALAIAAYNTSQVWVLRNVLFEDGFE